MSTRINMNMVDNGLDFIATSLKTINESNADLKYSLINLNAGIQLLLKELLFQEHWSLIFQDIDKADKAKLKSGDFVSVNHDTLIKRLKNIVGVELEENLKENLNWLRKERNKTEHFQFVATSDVLKSNIVSLLSYLIPFIKIELIDCSLIDSDDDRMVEIKDYLNNFEAYVQARLLLIEDLIAEIEVPLNCPICKQETVNLVDGTDVHCHFCDENIDSFSEKYIDTFIDVYSYVMDGGESPLYECLECESETFIYLDGHQYVCLTCGIKPTQDELTTCTGPSCNGKFLYRHNEEVTFCSYCHDYFINA